MNINIFSTCEVKTFYENIFTLKLRDIHSVLITTNKLREHCDPDYIFRYKIKQKEIKKESEHQEAY